jgi:hypothetical protein
MLTSKSNTFTRYNIKFRDIFFYYNLWDAYLPANIAFFKKLSPAYVLFILKRAFCFIILCRKEWEKDDQ